MKGESLYLDLLIRISAHEAEAVVRVKQSKTCGSHQGNCAVLQLTQWTNDLIVTVAICVSNNREVMIVSNAYIPPGESVEVLIRIWEGLLQERRRNIINRGCEKNH